MFWIFTLLAFLTSLAGGVAFVTMVDAPTFLDPLSERLRGLDQSGPITIASLAVPVILILLAYVWSFRSRRRRRRPIIALYLLGLSLFWLVAALVATTVGADAFFTPGPLAIAGGAWLVLAAAPRLVEMIIGRFTMGIGEALLKKKKWDSASSMLGLARQFLPGDDRLGRDQGLALFELGDAEPALDLMTEVYQRGDRDPRLVRALADSVFELPESLAGPVLADALKLDPANAKFGRKLVDLHLRQKRPAEALPVLEQFYDAHGIEDVSLLARLNAEQGNVDRALELMRQAVELEGPPFNRSLADLQVLAMQAPHNGNVLLALAELSERAGNRDEAASWFRELLDVDDRNTDARRRLIRLYRALGRLDQSLPHYRELLRQAPESREVALEYGQILEDRHDFEKAITLFEEFAARCPDDHRFDHQLAICLFGLERLDEASAALERARPKAPESDRGRIQSLSARIQAARIDQELTTWREQARQPGAPLELRLSYIDRLIQFQQAEQATRELDMLIEQMPDGRAEVIRFLEERVRQGGSQFVLLNMLADLYLQDRDFDRSHDLHATMARQSMHPDEILADGCKKILRQQPEHLPSLRSQSELFVKSGHYREAARVLGKILDLSPPAREDLLPMLFEVYYQLGDPDHAIPFGEELLNRDSQNLNLYLRMRELMTRRDDHWGAIRITKRALEVAPGNRQLREMLEESETHLREQRIATLREQLKNEPDQALLLHELADLYVQFDRLNDAITAFQRAAQNAAGNLRNLCLIKLAHCLTRKQMFDLADETIGETDLSEKNTEYLDEIKSYLYEVARLFEMDEQFVRALQIYKRVFRLDAGYRDVVSRIEVLSHLR
jgi:tetratricopeptide (TPR) repeat protein